MKTGVAWMWALSVGLACAATNDPARVWITVPDAPPTEAAAPEMGMEDLREIFERLRQVERSHAEREAELRRLQEQRSALEAQRAALEARRAELEARQAKLRAALTAAETAERADDEKEADWLIALAAVEIAAADGAAEPVRLSAGTVVRFRGREDDGRLRVRHECRVYTAPAETFAPEPVVRARLEARRKAALKDGDEAQAGRLAGVLEDLRERLRAAAAADLIPAVQP